MLSGAGATVVLGDIDGPGVEATVKEIDRRGGKAVGVEMDVTRRTDVDALVGRATGDYGRIDIMGNIAGVRSDGPVVDITDDEFERVLDINLRGVFYGCQAALRAMIPQGSGIIINISSGIVDDPGPTMATYGMTKAAVAQLTKTIAWRERSTASGPMPSPRGSSCRTFPGRTSSTNRAKIDPARFDAYIEWAATLSPVARVGTPAEVAWMILYLVSDAASFVTGQIVRPNGGSSMPW